MHQKPVREDNLLQSIWAGKASFIFSGGPDLPPSLGPGIRKESLEAQQIMMEPLFPQMAVCNAPNAGGQPSKSLHTQKKCRDGAAKFLQISVHFFECPTFMLLSAASSLKRSPLRDLSFKQVKPNQPFTWASAKHTRLLRQHLRRKCKDGNKANISSIVGEKKIWVGFKWKVQKWIHACV